MIVVVWAFSQTTAKSTTVFRVHASDVQRGSLGEGVARRLGARGKAEHHLNSRGEQREIQRRVSVALGRAVLFSTKRIPVLSI